MFNKVDSLNQRLINLDTRAEAFAETVRTFSPMIYRQIRRMVQYHDDANDVMQETFLKAWSALDQFKGDSKVSTWLYRIAINESLAFLARQKSNISFSETETEQHLLADEYFDGDELQAKLQSAIITLPEKQRIVFNMKYFEEMKYEEMSKILNTSVGALKASYHLAVKKIEEYFQEHD